MLKAENIHKSFGELEVLKGIDLEITRKEIVAIQGVSGAGKSTLLHLLGTLDKPDRGQVLINDIQTTTMNRNQLAEFRNNHIGFVFQFHNLLPEFTALENVCLPGYMGDRNENGVVERGKELLEVLGITDRSDHKPSELSGGEQQRTAVARALINAPDIVFADEPSGNLDSKNAEELHKLFFDLRDKLGHTFVIVTHNEELANQSDRKLHIKDGIIDK